MERKTKIFETTYRDYLARLPQQDLPAVAERLGATMAGEEMTIPFFTRPYRVSANGIYDLSGNQANFAVSVVLCQYILRCPDKPPPDSGWVSFRDFKNAGPLMGNFAANTHRLIAQRFSGRSQQLDIACRTLGGQTEESDLSYDLSLRFDALPRVPIFLLFNDKDSEFPAQCNLLFKPSAEYYLDMECLSIIGTFLAGNLN
ncbi:MAG: DUF3786 domain-containing protein [Desulfobacterales bacterium]